MIKEKIQKILNKQINEELYSSYLYLSMSNYFSSQNLDGFANWMRMQSVEEYAHGMKIYDYILQRDGKVALIKLKHLKPSGNLLWKFFRKL